MLTLTSLARADHHMLLNAGNDVQRWWRLETGIQVFIAVCVCHFLACMLANGLWDAGKYRYHHRRHHGVYYLQERRRDI